MPFYDYRCECGVIVENVEQAMSDEHVHTCPSCGGGMRQDFTNYRPPALTGDLPTTGCWNGYYDPNLRANITSARQRKDLMKQKGLEEFHMGDEQAKMHKEVEYVRKHADKREASPAINKMAGDVKKKQDERYIATITDPVIDKVVAALPG